MKLRAYYIFVFFILLSLGCKTVTSIGGSQIAPTQTTQNNQESSTLPSNENPSLLSNLSIEWVTFLGTNVLENDLTAAKSDNDGNLYLLKQSAKYSDDGDLVLIKIDATGKQSQITIVQHSATSTYNNHLAFDIDGNIYVTGASAKSWGNPKNQFGSTIFGGTRNVFIAKIDKQGNLIWNTFINSLWITPIATDKLGNIFFARFDNAFNRSEGFTLVKLDVDGQIVWEEKFPISAFQVEPYDISVDADGNIYITGHKEINEGDEDKGFLAKFSKDGKLIWETKFGGTGTQQQIEDFVMDNNGNAYIMGSSNANWGKPVVPYTIGYVFLGDDPNGITDYVAKFDNSGNLLWNTFLWGSTNYGSIVLDSHQNLLVSGRIEDGDIIQIDSNGTILSATSINNKNTDTGSEQAYYFVSDNNGNYYYIEETETSFGNPINPMTLDKKLGLDTYVAYISLP